VDEAGSMTTAADEIVLHQALGVQVREIDDEKREATFVASTENGVRTYGGIEFLRMKGARLKRYRRNPVVLDTHDRYSAESIVGSATVKVEGRELIARIRYAKTDRANTVWELVRDGHLRAVSIGYVPNAEKTRLLGQGEVDGDAPNQIVGPGRVVREWELLEISMVPIPADEDALRRTFNERVETAMQYSQLPGLNTQDPKPEGRSQAPAPEPKPEAPTPTAPSQVDEADAREFKRVELIRRYAPRGLESVADQLVLEGASVEDAKKRFADEIAAQSQPVGTPPPADAPTGGTDADAEEKQREQVDLAVRSLFNVRS